MRAVTALMPLCGPLMASGFLSTAIAQTDSRGPERLSESEAIEVVRRVATQQELMNAVTAEFELSFVLKTAEEFTAKYKWFRSGESERMERRFFDAPHWAELHGFQDQVIVSTSDGIVESFPATHQGILSAAGHDVPAVFVPLDFLRPGTRRDFAELERAGAKFEATRLSPHVIELRYALPEAPEKRVSVRVENRDDRYLVTGWSCEECKTRFTVEYEKQPDGHWFPSVAKFESDSDARAVRRATMRTVSATLKRPPEDAFAFQFKRGALVTDHRTLDKNGKSRAFSAEEDGKLVPVHVIHPARPDSPAQRSSMLGASAASAGLIFAVLVGRWIHRRKQAA